MHDTEQKCRALTRLLDIMVRLREKCPWNREQTFASLRTLTLEEAYELSDALLQGSPQEVKKELGDLLLHVVFYARIAEEQGLFDFADVADAVSGKMEFRHPHVFGEGDGSEAPADAEAVSRAWERRKLQEKGGNAHVLSGVPKSAPALLKAFAMQEKASGVGFDWDDRREVWDKVREEVEECHQKLERLDALLPDGSTDGAWDGFRADPTGGFTDGDSNGLMAPKNSSDSCSSSPLGNAPEGSPDGSPSGSPSNSPSDSPSGSSRDSLAGDAKDAALEAARRRVEDELGDVLFSLVNVARHYGIDPDAALSHTCEKFRSRFTYIEEQTLGKGRQLADLTLAEMDALWDEAKCRR